MEHGRAPTAVDPHWRAKLGVLRPTLRQTRYTTLPSPLTSAALSATTTCAGEVRGNSQAAWGPWGRVICHGHVGRNERSEERRHDSPRDRLPRQRLGAGALWTPMWAPPSTKHPAPSPPRRDTTTASISPPCQMTTCRAPITGQMYHLINIERGRRGCCGGGRRGKNGKRILSTYQSIHAITRK